MGESRGLNSSERKRQLKAHMDHFIAMEKQRLADGEGDDELQYRLDRFMIRLHERVDHFMQGENAMPEPEAASFPSAVDEPAALIPVSEALYLQETIGAARAEQMILSLEDEFRTYNITALNLPEPVKGWRHHLSQSLAAVAAALVLVWLLLPLSAVTEQSEPSAKVATQLPHQIPVSETQKADELTVMTSFGNVRERPSAKADVVFVISRGEVVKSHEVKWGWHHIELNDGRRGWAYKGLFSSEPQQG